MADSTLLHGTREPLVLKTLSLAPMHGHAFQVLDWARGAA